MKDLFDYLFILFQHMLYLKLWILQDYAFQRNQKSNI